MTRRACFVVVLMVAAISTPGQTFVVLPFENTARSANLDWLSEGLAELTVQRLVGDARTVFPREDWLGVLERIGLPAMAPRTGFSRATTIKIGEHLGADFVVLGRFSASDGLLRIAARVLRTRPAALSREFEETGPLEQLMDVHARVAWSALRYADPALVISQEEFLRTTARRRLDAFESYIRGLLALNGPQKLRLLRDAARLEQDWAEPAFALGQAYFAGQDYTSALIWLSRVPPRHPRGLEAGFSAGVCHLMRNDAARAEAAFSSLGERADADEHPFPEVLNNLGVALARLNRWSEAIPHWREAAEADAEEPDYWFNLALGAIRTDSDGEAVTALREALSRDPDDLEARALLAWALEQAGQSREAEAVRRAASEPLPPVDVQLPWRERIKMKLELTGPVRLRPQTPAQDESQRAATPHAGGGP